MDLDPCLTKKPVEDSACHPYNTRGSMSEVQSLSSFQSESCDDNGTLPLSTFKWRWRRKQVTKTAESFENVWWTDTCWRCHSAFELLSSLLRSDQPAWVFLQQLPLLISVLTLFSLHAENGRPWWLLWGHVIFSLSFCCGASAPIWIKSVHRSRTRF